MKKTIVYLVIKYLRDIRTTNKKDYETVKNLLHLLLKTKNNADVIDYSIYEEEIESLINDVHYMSRMDKLKVEFIKDLFELLKHNAT